MSDSNEVLSGGQFARHVGTDPAKWAARFLMEYQSFEASGGGTDDDRRAFITAWFRDAMDAAVKASERVIAQSISRMADDHWR